MLSLVRAVAGLGRAVQGAEHEQQRARVVLALVGTVGRSAAQYFQALAARRVPEVWMNLRLFQARGGYAGQVVVLGEVDEEFRACRGGRAQQFAVAAR